MNERDLLAAAAASRVAFSTIEKYIGLEDLTDTGTMLWDIMGQYYQRDSAAEYIHMPTYTELVDASVTNPKHKATLGAVVESIGSSDVSGVNVAQALLAHKREVVGHRLSTALLSGENTDELMAQYGSLMSATDLEDADTRVEVVWGADPSSDFQDDYKKDLIMLFPRSLNDRLAGGMMKGHHVILFARPEMGKTSMMANFVAGFLKQGKRTLYLGNEDPIKDIRLKFLGRVLEMQQADIIADMGGATLLAKNERNWDLLGTAQISPGTPWEIEQLVKQFKPDVLIVDQLRNIQVRGSKSDGVVQHLENAAKAIRQIGIRHDCLVISTTQAGDSASGKGILDMSDVDSSKTGIPAQAEVMIGVGATSEDEAAGRRVISLPKNKRSGKHEFFPVQADFSISKFTSMD